MHVNIIAADYTKGDPISLQFGHLDYICSYGKKYTYRYIVVYTYITSGYVAALPKLASACFESNQAIPKQRTH